MPAEGRSPDPTQARKRPTVPVIDDESTNTARKAEKVQTSLQTKAKTEPAARRLEMGVVQVRVAPKTKNPFSIKALSFSGVTWKWHVLNHARGGNGGDDFRGVWVFA